MKPYYDYAGITIYHGDCRDILPQLKADAIVTDPPYNCGKDYGVYKDNLKDSEYREVMKSIIELSFISAKNQFWVAPRYKLEFFLSLLHGSHLIVIRRGAMGPFRGGWSDQFEIALAVGTPLKCTPDLWENIRLKGEGYFFREQTFGHPGYTPYLIMSRAVNLMAEKTVIDPFAGTGTTLRAAKELKICAVGIEINEAYCEIAANRMAQEVMEF